MTKAARQGLLLEIVRGRSIRTQEDLAAALARQGIEASQVTLSRDLRELGVVKTPEGYREPETIVAPTPEESLQRVLRTFVVSIQPAGNLVVVRTNAGAAGPVALALDRSGRDEIVGTIAGDDTIFVATESTGAAKGLARSLAEPRG